MTVRSVPVEQQIIAVSSAQRARDDVAGALSALAENWKSIPDVDIRREAAKAVAAAFGGMFVKREGRGGARKGKIQFGNGDLADGKFLQGAL